MRKLLFLSLLVGLSVLLAACGTAATPTAAAKPVNIRVETSPDPAMMGALELLLIITDADGNPIEGAKVDVSVDHTDMTGMSMGGLATDQGGGKYAITADFSMSGNWLLTVYVRKDGLDYQEEIELPVQ